MMDGTASGNCSGNKAFTGAWNGPCWTCGRIRVTNLKRTPEHPSRLFKIAPFLDISGEWKYVIIILR